MADPLDVLPEAAVFAGPPDGRYLALRLEILFHDVSLDGDAETAMALAGYLAGEEPAPADVPTFVSLDGDRVTVSNPPFLLAEFTLAANDSYRLDAAFDSQLTLLIEPPVRVTYRGDLESVVSEVEQTIAAIYRTRGRHLEQLFEGVVDR